MGICLRDLLASSLCRQVRKRAYVPKPTTLTLQVAGRKRSAMAHARRDQGRSAGRASGKICSAHIRLSADYPRASLIVGSYLAASKPSANVKAHRRRGNDKFTLAWLTHATKPSAGGGCNNNALPIDRP
jgi:hypothetical protein